MGSGRNGERFFCPEKSETAVSEFFGILRQDAGSVFSDAAEGLETMKEEMMNIGQNMLNFVTTNAGPLVLMGLVILGVIFIMKRKTTELIGTIIVGIIAVGLVYDTAGVKTVLLSIWKAIIGS